MVKEGMQCKTKFNEAYDSVTQVNVVYETIKEISEERDTPGFAKGLQINAAYDSITANKPPTVPALLAY